MVLEDIDADDAELVEIDENLIRAELTPTETAIHVGRRKELYEKLHPETKQGAAPGAGKGKGKQSSQVENLPFVINTARKTRKGRSTVAKAVTRSKKVKVLPVITGTSLEGQRAGRACQASGGRAARAGWPRQGRREGQRKTTQNQAAGSLG